MYGSRFPEVRRFDELDSTNRYLLDEARSGAPTGTVAVAGHQTAGRGRRGRRWEAPAGANLLASVLLRPALATEELHLCTVAVALAAAEACGAVAGLEPGLKWPNDLLVGEKKLAGILAESTPDGDGARAVVVGIGVNLTWPPPEAVPTSPRVAGNPGSEDPVPESLASATSVWRESGVRVEPEAFLEVFLGYLSRRIDELEEAGGRRRLASDYRRCCVTLHSTVAVTLDQETVRGRVLDITGEGHLLVDTGVCIRTITAGDVEHLPRGALRGLYDVAPCICS